MPYTYFSIYPKTKLKFNPNVGTDVALPTPNKATQYLPNITDNSCDNPIKNSLVGKEPDTFSTSSSGDYPSAGTMLRNTPVADKYKSMVPAAPQASTTSSISTPSSGVSKPDMTTLNTKSNGDSRVTLDSRMIKKDKSFKGAGLLGKNPNRSYYRQVLNAI